MYTRTDIYIYIYVYIYIVDLLWDLKRRWHEELPAWSQDTGRSSAVDLKIFAGRKAPAAAIKKNKNVNNMIVIIFNNIHSEKGACGRYNQQ